MRLEIHPAYVEATIEQSKLVERGYVLVEAPDADRLSIKVSAYMKNGWTPVSGTVYAYTGRLAAFYQPMTRPHQ